MSRSGCPHVPAGHTACSFGCIDGHSAGIPLATVEESVIVLHFVSGIALDVSSEREASPHLCYLCRVAGELMRGNIFRAGLKAVLNHRSVNDKLLFLCLNTFSFFFFKIISVYRHAASIPKWVDKCFPFFLRASIQN